MEKGTIIMNGMRPTIVQQRFLNVLAVRGAQLGAGETAAVHIVEAPAFSPLITFDGNEGAKGIGRFAGVEVLPRIITREILEQRELRELAPYAAMSSLSRGRVVCIESKDPLRTEFMRDRDRILHSFALRRLMHVRQVAYEDGNVYKRTRYSHTIEVAQIARTLATALGLNADLAEAIALGHDVGHPAFGHDGEVALDAMMRRMGLRFEHNAQSYRIVRHLARHRPEYPGLNLSLETLYGVALHTSSYDAPHHGAIDIELPRFPPLEGQLVNIADEIAYIAHDLDDALQAGALTFKKLISVPLFGAIVESLRRSGPLCDPFNFRHLIKSNLIEVMVHDVLDETAQRLEACAPRSVEEVYEAVGLFAAFSREFTPLKDELRTYLFEHVYKAGAFEQRAQEARGMMTDLFEHYLAHAAELPPFVKKQRRTDASAQNKYQRICDYLAGLTDAQATKLFRELI